MQLNALSLLLLIGFAAAAAVMVAFARRQKAFALIVRLSSAVIMALTVFAAVTNYEQILTVDLSAAHGLKLALLIGEAGIAAFVIVQALLHRKYLAAALSAAQIGVMAAYELFYAKHTDTTITIYVDKLSVLMLVIVGVIGSLICVYAVEYMKDYHRHHKEYKDRRGMFFALMFAFMSAMFGLVLCNDMIFMLFFWEITTLCSFLLIGYTKTPEAVKNSFKALTVNVGGGLMFTIGIFLLGVHYGVTDFQGLLNLGETTDLLTVAVILIAGAGLTKAAQMPFSEWLTGAMVAPTPTSALLHSSTMVKAGVYLIIRLAPTLGDNTAGVVITTIGGVTFFMTALIAVGLSDAKKILAYSTISNLGLIVACAGMNTAESLWAAVMLIVFHAIAKSLLFLSVGSTEHQLGSRSVEAMDGLYKISTALTMFLVIGIAGMFIAPFGMLISKWAAMKAFIDSGNVLIVMIIAFGSTVTLFFWTKWLGKLLANAHHTHHEDYIMRVDEKVSLFALGAMVIVVCALHPVISSAVVIPYINSNMHIDFVSPINPLATSIIIFMMCLLFIMPLILIPVYKNYRVKPTSVYLSGENAGDNESFRGSAGKTVRVELRNWYLERYLRADRWGPLTQIVCAGILVVGFCFAIGGLL